MQDVQRVRSKINFVVAEVNECISDMANQPRLPRKRRRLYLFIVIGVLLASTGAGATDFDYQRLNTDYSANISLAQTGAQNLRQAITTLETLPRSPLNVNVVSQAQHEFGLALDEFEQIDNDLSPLPGIMSIIPVYGAPLGAALHLVAIAVGASQAGVSACAILSTLLKAYQTLQGGLAPGIDKAEWAAIASRFQQVSASLTQVINETSQLQSVDIQFIPSLGKMLATFQKDLPTLQLWLADANSLMGVLPMLLGINTPANYLIELLDTTELRPTGGFIGNIGFATLDQGRLSSVHITDVDLLDKPFEFSGHRIQYPADYRWFSHYLSQGTWLLRDSNLDADFPTAARYSELNYQREGGKVALQGVIAITPALIEQFLEITGPIYVPEYKETVTAQNLIDRIHYHQLGPGIGGSDTVPAPGGHSSLRKQFTELLTEHFFARFRQLPSSMLPRIMQVLIHAFNTKDVQVYVNANAAENVLRQVRLDDSIQSPPGDGLFIVDTNVGGDKANRYITSTLSDKVNIDEHGNAIHYTTITYAWLTPGPIYGRSLYQDYVRIYVPPRATLQTQQGWESQGSGISFGRQVWAGYFTLTFGQSRAIRLTWLVPRAASFDVMGWQYPYLIQHQAGTRWTVLLSVMVPSTCKALDVSGGWVSGKQSELRLNQSFDEDLALSVDYLC
jgi:hypothetical protein